MARTAETVLVREPVGCASQMRATGPQRVEALLGSDDPHALLVKPARVNDAYFIGLSRPCVEFLRRLVDDVGEKEARGGRRAGAKKSDQASPTEPQKVASRHLRRRSCCWNLRRRRCLNIGWSRITVCHDCVMTLTIRPERCQQWRSIVSIGE